mmetsp:Transcript_14128/g.41022  ORF Transcript_14128/g.41022 Transcript_14128/m.41022 type:complete len:284 (-) Transcript_14128:922-1773(-)
MRLEHLAQHEEHRARVVWRRVVRHLQQPLGHGCDALGRHVCLHRLEHQAQEHGRLGRSSGPVAEQHGVQRAVEAVGDSVARRHELVHQHERLHADGEWRGVDNLEERLAAALHQRLDLLLRYVGEGTPYARDKRAEHARVHLLGGGAVRRARRLLRQWRRPPRRGGLVRCFALLLAELAQLGLVALVLHPACLASSAKVALDDEPKDGEVQLRKLLRQRGATLAGPVAERQLVEEHNAEVPSALLQSRPEQKALNLTNHDRLHRWVLKQQLTEQESRFRRHLA